MLLPRAINPQIACVLMLGSSLFVAARARDLWLKKIKSSP